MDNKLAMYSAVIPIFNESKNIPVLYKRLKDVMDGLGGKYEIILVDDGSKDSSYQLLKDIALKDNAIKVIGFLRNFGQHKAVVAGLQEATGDYIITLDADLQNPPEEIPKLLAKLKEGFDMVSGRRLLRKDNFFRRFCSFFVNLIISVVTGLRMRDYGSMLRVFQNKTAKGLVDVFLATGGYITMLVARVTRNVAEIPVHHDQRYAGESKYSLKKLFSVFFKIIFSYHKKKKLEESVFIIARRIEYGKEYEFTP